MSSSISHRPGNLSARYETLRMLGQGGAGAVYLARDRETAAVRIGGSSFSPTTRVRCRSLLARPKLPERRTIMRLHGYRWAAEWLEEDWDKWKHSRMRMTAFMSLLAIGGRLRYVVNGHVEERRDEDNRRSRT
jgi:hypothetical protein